MDEKKAPVIGLIGFGEVGSSFGRGFKSAGIGAMSCLDGFVLSFDKYRDGRYGPLMEARARETGVTLVDSRQELAPAEIVISCVTVSEAVNAARETAACLRSGTIYVDVNSTSPKVKRETAAIVEAASVRYVDGTIMSAPVLELHRVPMLAAGAAAEEFRDRLAPFGTNIRVVGREPGMAASIKIIRSVLSKGLEALYAEAMLGARRYGMEKEVLASFAEFMDARSSEATAKLLLTSHVIHAQRRAAEVEGSLQTLCDVGIEPVMTRATIRLLTRTAEMGLKEKFGGQQPSTIEEALTAMDEALGSS